MGRIVKNKKLVKAAIIIMTVALLIKIVPLNTAHAQQSNYSFLSQLFDYGVNYAFTGNAMSAQINTGVQEALGTAPSDAAGNAVTKTVLWIVQLINQVFGFIAGVLIYLGSVLINTTFDLNNYLIQLPIVQSGWQITRDIANLGFVLALIIMAFMTILRIDQYGAQKMLPKLIAAAILVNFSLTIGGAILDFTNVVTKFFIDRSIGNGSWSQSLDIGTTLTNAFNPQNLLSVNTQKIQGLSISLTTNFVAAASSFFVAAFTFLMGLTLLAIALMLLTRFVWLAFLMAVAPMPWLFGVIPVGGLGGMAKQWWSKFMHWAFVAPFLSFFLYLTLATATKVGNIADSIINQSSTAGNNPTFIAGFVSQTVNMLILVGFLVGGLIASNSMGIIGAGAVYGLAKSAGNKAKSFAKNQTAGRAGALGNRLLTTGAKGDKEGKSVFERWAEGGAGKIPVLGAAFRGLAGASLNAKEKSKDQIDNSYKNNKKFSSDALANKLNNQKIMNDDDLGAALALVEKKGGWSKLDSGTQARIIAAVKRTGSASKFAAYNPTLAMAAGMPPDRAVRMVEDVSKLDETTIENIAPYANKQQIRDLGNKGTLKQQQAFESGIKKAFTTATRNQSQTNQLFDDLEGQQKNLDENIRLYADAKDKGDKAEMERLKGARNLIIQQISAVKEGLVDARNIPLEKEVQDAPEDKRQDKINEIKERREKLIETREYTAKQTTWQNVYKKHLDTDKGGEEA